MSLSNAFMCRELTPLLDNADDPTDEKIRNRIRDAESKILMWLSGRYAIPILPTSYLTGTITVNADSRNIEGSGTAFTSLQPGQTIQVVSTGEAIQILTINSDTFIVCNSNAINNSTDSLFWVIPDELVTASKFLSTHLTIMLHFPEKTLKQDNVEKFDRRMEIFAGDILKILETGQYLNTNLIAQISDKSIDRLVYIGIENDNRERIDRNHDLFHSRKFK